MITVDGNDARIVEYSNSSDDSEELSLLFVESIYSDRNSRDLAVFSAELERFLDDQYHLHKAHLENITRRLSVRQSQLDKAKNELYESRQSCQKSELYHEKCEGRFEANKERLCQLSEESERQKNEICILKGWLEKLVSKTDRFTSDQPTLLDQLGRLAEQNAQLRSTNRTLEEKIMDMEQQTEQHGDVPDVNELRVDRESELQAKLDKATRELEQRDAKLGCLTKQNQVLRQMYRKSMIKSQHQEQTGVKWSVRSNGITPTSGGNQPRWTQVASPANDIQTSIDSPGEDNTATATRRHIRQLQREVDGWRARWTRQVELLAWDRQKLAADRRRLLAERKKMHINFLHSLPVNNPKEIDPDGQTTPQGHNVKLSICLADNDPSSDGQRPVLDHVTDKGSKRADRSDLLDKDNWDTRLSVDWCTVNGNSPDTNNSAISSATAANRQTKPSSSSRVPRQMATSRLSTPDTTSIRASNRLGNKKTSNDGRTGAKQKYQSASTTNKAGVVPPTTNPTTSSANSFESGGSKRTVGGGNRPIVSSGDAQPTRLSSEHRRPASGWSTLRKAVRLGKVGAGQKGKNSESAPSIIPVEASGSSTTMSNEETVVPSSPLKTNSITKPQIKRHQPVARSTNSSSFPAPSSMKTKIPPLASSAKRRDQPQNSSVKSGEKPRWNIGRPVDVNEKSDQPIRRQSTSRSTARVVTKYGYSRQRPRSLIVSRDPRLIATTVPITDYWLAGQFASIGLVEEDDDTENVFFPSTCSTPSIDQVCFKPLRINDTQMRLFSPSETEMDGFEVQHL